MTQEHLGREYISAFLRDALRTNASPWIVTNVMRIWLDHGVPAAAMLTALGAVAAEHPLDPEQIDSYRDAVVDMLSGAAPIPSQRTGQHESYDVTIRCPACGEELQLNDGDSVLHGNVASFTREHSACATSSVRTHLQLP